MSDFSEAQPLVPEAERFTAILLPHRSLSRKGFVILMALVGLSSCAAGLIFVFMGAWPVTGFFGLDVLLLYGAFQLNYRAGRLFEKIELDENELRVTRVYPSGHAESWSFNPYWVRLELEEHETSADVMSLRSHGKVLVFGSFLSDGEKKDFAQALKQALATHRSSKI